MIVAIDGHPVEDPKGFDYRLATPQIGGREQSTSSGAASSQEAVPLEVAPDTGRDETVLTERKPFQGTVVANLSPAVAESCGWTPTPRA